LLFNQIPFHENWFPHKNSPAQFNAQRANNTESLFSIPKIDLHVDTQLLKVRNDQKMMCFTIGHCQAILKVKIRHDDISWSWANK
jgi:hypothetical protein